MRAGSITFATDLDNKKLEKELAKTRGEIEKLEDSVSSQEAEKSPLIQQAQALEQSIKAARAEAERLGEQWRAGLSGADKDQSVAILKAQQLEAQHAKVVTQIEKMDKKLIPAYGKLDRMRAAAGGIQRQLHTSAQSASYMGPALARADRYMAQFVTRMKALARRAIIFYAISMALRSMRDWMGKVVRSNTEATASIAKLKGAMLTLAQPLVRVIIPAFTTFVNLLTTIVSALANVMSMIFGTTAQASADAAEALHKQTEALGGVGGAAKKAGKSLASFDEINKLSSDTGGSGGGGSASIGPDFSIAGKLDEITAYVSGALLALGAVLTFTGVNIPLGLTLMALGAAGLASLVATNWGAMDEGLKLALTRVFIVLGSFALVIGAVLAFTGVNLPLGIGLMAAGAGMLGVATALNWGAMSPEMQSALVGILKMVGAFLLVIGLILALTGAAIPLGIGLIVAGAAALGGAAFLSWKVMGDSIEEVLTEILLIATAVLAAVGLILLATGNIPLGIGLLVAGAAALGGAAALNWTAIVDAVQGPMGEIMAAASGAFLVLGLILALSGAAIPLGIGLIFAGSAGLVTVTAINWNAILDKLKEVWGNIKAWWDTHVAKFFSVDFWKGLGGDILDGLFGGLSPAKSKMSNWSGELIGETRDRLGIHSPSTEFGEIGEYMALGLVQKLKKGMSSVTGVFSDVLGASLASVQATTLDMQTSFAAFLTYISTEFRAVWETSWGRFRSISGQNIQAIMRDIDALNAKLAAIERNIVITITTVQKSGSSGGSSTSGSAVAAQVSAMPMMGEVPKLATGAVIPPNREFLAVLGDQRSGTNIETPLATMVQAFKQAVVDVGMAGGGDTTVVLELDGQQFGRAVFKANNRESRRVGVSLVGV